MLHLSNHGGNGFSVLRWSVGLIVSFLLNVFDFQAAAVAQTSKTNAPAASLSPRAEGNSIPSQYTSRTWQAEEGLPNDVVHAVAQASDGYLWVGTRHGLARFNGHGFEIFEPKETQLINNFITALSAGSEGDLWIGSNGGGVAQWKDGRFRRFGIAEGLSGEAVRAILRCHDGSIWVGTVRGVFRFQDGRWVCPADDLANVVVRALCEDKEGNIWIATNRGVVQWNKKIVKIHTESDGLISIFTRSLWADKQGRIWIGTEEGLGCLEPGRAAHYTTEQGLPDNHVTAVFEDRFGTIWVGTYGGLARLQNGKMVPQFNNEGTAYDMVNRIFEDREGNLWVAAKDGLHRLSKRVFTTFTTQQGLAHNNVVSVCGDNKDGLWVGTWGGGLHQFTNGTFKVFSPKDPGPGQVRVPNIATDLILGLYWDNSRQALWIGSDFTGGLFEYWTGLFAIYGKNFGLNDRAIRVIREDRKKNLWLGTRMALVHFIRGTNQFVRYTTEDGLVGNDIHALCETKAGGLWVGTSAGLSWFQDGQFENFTVKDGLPATAIMALHHDTAGTLWIGTAGGGLGRMKNEKVKLKSGEKPPGKDRFTFYKSEHGLFSDHLSDIVEDDFGFLWLASAQGIFHVNKKNLDAFADGQTNRIKSVSYGKADGLASTYCNNVAKPGAWKTKDGRLWFAMTKGLSVIDPKVAAAKSNSPPPIVIEKVIENKRLVGVQSLKFKVQGQENGGRASSTLRSEPETLNLPPGRGELEFHYAALSYTAPEKNRFKYRLEGFDSDWVDAGARRVAYYNNLRPGRYRFQVIACNNDGLWNSLGANVKFSLQPHFWQTLTFQTFTIVGVLGMVGGAVRWTTRRKMQRQLERLEQQHAIEQERSRIARDMHDELGAKLTKISLLGELAKREIERPREISAQIEQIMDTSSEVVQSLDEIVWAVNPKNDTLDNFATYLCRHASEFFENTSVACELDIPAALPDCALSTDVRHNLFLSAKEALNNVLKHSRATKVVIRLVVHPDAFELSISDNGCGFDTHAKTAASAGESGRTKRTGNGLRNLQTRLKEIGGRCLIESDARCGTKITFSVPLRSRKSNQ